MRRVLACVALGAALLAPTARADTEQGVNVEQASQATAVAGALVTAGGGTCFAGCPTIVVSPATAVAATVNVAAVMQLLNQIALRS
jgi:hypothetical protein